MAADPVVSGVFILTGVTEFETVAAARDMVLGHTASSARDAIYVVVMRRLGCDRILTFDRGLHAVPGTKRGS